MIVLWATTSTDISPTSEVQFYSGILAAEISKVDSGRHIAKSMPQRRRSLRPVEIDERSVDRA